MGVDQWQHRQLIAGHVQCVETVGREGGGRGERERGREGEECFLTIND